MLSLRGILFSPILLGQAGESDSWLSKVLIGLAGIGVTFVGFFLNQVYQNQKEKLKELKQYAVALQSAANEVSFYRAKLCQLSEALERILNQLKNGEWDVIIPSYSLYPDFLEKCKHTLSSFFENSELVQNIGHCHFELCHIVARLEQTRTSFEESIEKDEIRRILTLRYKNTEGFKRLVDANIPVFQETVELLLAENAKIERESKLMRETSLLPLGDPTFKR